MTAQGYFKSDGAWVPNKELVGLDETGKPLELLNSTLNGKHSLKKGTKKETKSFQTT